MLISFYYTKVISHSTFSKVDFIVAVFFSTPHYHTKLSGFFQETTHVSLHCGIAQS